MKDDVFDDVDECDDEVCVFCGLPAVDEYEGSPTCGRVKCELRIQAASDYHSDRGG